MYYFIIAVLQLKMFSRKGFLRSHYSFKLEGNSLWSVAEFIAFCGTIFKKSGEDVIIRCCLSDET